MSRNTFKINENNDEGKLVCYLSYQLVIKNTGSTTMVRVVFDTNSKSETGISLKDGHFVGAVVQNDFISTLLAFRWLKYIIFGRYIKYS